MAQPSPAIRQRLAQLKAEAMIRAERDAQRQKAIQNAEKAAGQPVGLPTDKKAKGGSVWNSPDWKPHPENDLLQPIGASKMVGDERLLSQDDTFSHGLSEFPSSKKSYRYLYHGEDNKPIGAMQIQTTGPRSKKAVIQNLYVAEANRRQGIASKLLDRARQDFDVKHSTDLTTAGRAFAKAKKASGGSIPSQDVMRLAIGGQGPRNFLKGSVEKVLRPLVASQQAIDPENLEPMKRQAQEEGPMQERARRRLAEHYHANAINDWIQRNLANYIRKQMGHPNDPLRKLAEEGVLHIDPEQLGVDEETADARRKMLNGEKLAKSPLAQAWENAVDTRFEPNTVEDVRNMPDVYRDMYEPWMEKADPKTNLYELYGANELGFDHIVDILKQDLAEGRIRPEQLNKVSIEQAVRRVHEYDQAQKKKMAETALKATEGMPVHKDYGNGYRWIELAPPKFADLPEGHTLVQHPTSKNWGVEDANGKLVNTDDGKMFKSEEEAIANANTERSHRLLKEALKYEGDTMGHCVGGYTPDVASGKSRIFSLRDEKNEPHVTVEVKAKKPQYEDIEKHFDEAHKEVLKEMNAQGLDTSDPTKANALAWKRAEEIALQTPQMNITQIKGKGNAKPIKNYMPFVHDFVRSSNMEVVGDLNHTDLRKVGNKYLTDDELDAIAKQHLGTVVNNPARYYSDMKRKDPSAISDADKNYINAIDQFQYPPHMADGGSVDAEAMFMGNDQSTGNEADAESAFFPS